jgi:hypothetical protein
VATVKLSSIINAGAPVLLLHINGRLTIEIIPGIISSFLT